MLLVNKEQSPELRRRKYNYAVSIGVSYELSKRIRDFLKQKYILVLNNTIGINKDYVLRKIFIEKK